MQYQNEKGETLYGYSQVNLENNTRAIQVQSKIIKWAVIVGGTIALLFWFLCCYVLYQIMYWDLFTKFIYAKC